MTVPPTGGRVVVEECRPSGHRGPAYVVRPEGPRPGAHPAVLWLHWLGDERSDRSEFLAEAVELAAQGVVSLLPDGWFPWRRPPDGTLADRAELAAELDRVAAAADALTALTAVDGRRLGVVGHDYGAMLALASRGLGARAVVAIAPDSSWHHWFETCWPHGRAADEGYRRAFADVDPLRGAACCADRLLLQWAGRDEYVPGPVPAAYAAAAPDSCAVSYPGTDHRVGAVAAADRHRFLLARLGALAT